MSKQEFNNVREKYADKIAKLLRKAESTTPEEAETCLRMAQNLMTKWGIDEAMLEAARGLSVDEIVTEEIVLTGGFRVALGELAMYVIHFNGGKAVLIENSPREVDGKVRKQTYILRVHAFKSDLERIRILNTSLQLQAMTSQNRWWKENRHLYFDKREEFLGRRQFIFSFARSAGTKIKEATERGPRAGHQGSGQGVRRKRRGDGHFRRARPGRPEDAARALVRRGVR